MISHRRQKAETQTRDLDMFCTVVNSIFCTSLARTFDPSVESIHMQGGYGHACRYISSPVHQYLTVKSSPSPVPELGGIRRYHFLLKSRPVLFTFCNICHAFRKSGKKIKSNYSSLHSPFKLEKSFKGSESREIIFAYNEMNVDESLLFLNLV